MTGAPVAARPFWAVGDTMTGAPRIRVCGGRWMPGDAMTGAAR